MPTYKNYVIKAGDTIESIASKYLGSGSNADKIISLNRLRYPYITEITADTYGTIKASGYLKEDWPKNSISLSVASHIESSDFPASALSPNSVFYIRTNTGNGMYLEDTFYIDQYYSSAYENFDSQTLVFQHQNVAPPQLNPEADGLLDVSSQCTFYGSITDTTLTISNVGSGFLSIGMRVRAIESKSSEYAVVVNYGTGTGGVGTYTLSNTITSSGVNEGLFISYIPPTPNLSARSYYVCYTFIRYSSSNQTQPSPPNINSVTKRAIPFVVQDQDAAEAVLVFRAPQVWPTGATGVNVYAGLNFDSMRYQATLTQPGQVWAEPVINNSGSNGYGISTTTVSAPSINTAYIGTSGTYPKNTAFYIYEDYQQYQTQILKVGDILLLPITTANSLSSISIGKRTPTFSSVLGADIKLDSYGIIDMTGNHNGDFQVVDGIENVKQSLLGRLSTKIGSLKTRMTFGNSAIDLVGAKYSATFLINLKVDLVDTLRAERRVYQVNDFNIRYDRKYGAIIINNLTVELLNDGQSASILTFEPIALPI